MPPARDSGAWRVTVQPGFSERIARRHRLWWRSGPQPLYAWRTYRDALHWQREKRTSRTRDDADEAWRCCAFWQRSLVNKWNGREFAARHGCTVPELYWRGRRAFAPAALRRASLPRHFVLRPVWGSGRRGVYVVTDGRDLLRDQAASPAELGARLLRSSPRSWTAPVLLEEFVRTEEGHYRLPLEYKCYTFGDTVAAVEMIERSSIYAGGARHRYYTPDWKPFADPVNLGLPPLPHADPPRCLDQMLRNAVRLGAAFGTFVRVDFFSTDRGCVFNEFSSTPGKGTAYTPYGDELLGALWTAKYPHAT